MAKSITQVVIPIILIGIFTIVVFIAIGYEQLNFLSYIVVLFLIVFIPFFRIAIGRNISFPIKKLLDKVIELSEGNLSSRVYLETKDEFPELAKIFNKIAEELEATHKQEKDIEKSLGIKVKAKTHELEETINALEQKVKNRTIELERLMRESNQLKEIIKDKEAEINRLKKNLEGKSK